MEEKYEWNFYYDWSLQLVHITRNAFYIHCHHWKISRLFFFFSFFFFPLSFPPPLIDSTFSTVLSIYLVGCSSSSKTPSLLSLHWMFCWSFCYQRPAVNMWSEHIPREEIPLMIYLVSYYIFHHLECEFIQAASVMLGDSFRKKTNLQSVKTQHIFFMGSTNRYMFWLIR